MQGTALTAVWVAERAERATDVRGFALGPAFELRRLALYGAPVHGTERRRGVSGPFCIHICQKVTRRCRHKCTPCPLVCARSRRSADQRVRQFCVNVMRPLPANRFPHPTPLTPLVVSRRPIQAASRVPCMFVVRRDWRDSPYAVRRTRRFARLLRNASTAADAPRLLSLSGHQHCSAARPTVRATEAELHALHLRTCRLRLCQTHGVPWHAGGSPCVAHVSSLCSLPIGPALER